MKFFFFFFSFRSFLLLVITISMGHTPENDNICMHHACLKVLEPQNSEALGVHLGFDPYFPRGFEIRGGAIRITNLIAGLFECLHKSFAYLFAQGNSFIYWHFDRGARTRLLCSAYSDFTVASFPIGLSLRTMQDLGSV